MLGIAGYKHKQLRHTFELDEEWTIYENLMPPSLLQLLNEIEETNLWCGMLLLQNQLSAASTREFSNSLSTVSMTDFYD